MKVLLISLLVLLYSCEIQAPQSNKAQPDSTSTELLNTYHDTDVAGAKGMINKFSDLVILDVRTPEEVAQGHIDKAKNIDYKADSFESIINELDKNQKYLVYCRSGRRSAAAAEIMTKAGFTDVTNMKGGYLAWSDAE